MKLSSSLLLAWVGLACGCSARVVESTHRAARPDAGAEVDSGVPLVAPETGIDGALEAGRPPYAACPNVFAGKIADAHRDDRGTEGLTVLRERVQVSRKVFEARHGLASGEVAGYWLQILPV